MITQDELRRKILEQPKDLDARLLWTDENPPPKLAIRCRECHIVCGELQLTWDDVAFELKHDRDPLRELAGICWKCAGPEVREEEEPCN